MKIVLINELYWPSIGGVESRFQAWADELLRQGHECEVWCIGHVAGLAEIEVVRGVTVRRIVAHEQYKSTGSARRHWPTVLRFCMALRREHRTLSGFDGVVLGKFPLLHALSILLPKGPVIRFDWCEMRSGRIWRLLYRLLARRPGLSHIAIHSGIAAWLRNCGVSPARVVVIGSASEPPVAAAIPTRVDRMILFVGRLSEHKQPLHLLEAFKAARLWEQGFTLHFVGSGPQADILSQQGRGVPSLVLHGRVSDEKKFELLAQASLLALPSLREGFPVVVAEACAVGTPTLTIESPDNGTAHIVRQLECGWVCADLPDALAASMAKYACVDTEEWVRCAAVARARSIDTLSIAKQTRTLVEALISVPRVEGVMNG